MKYQIITLLMLFTTLIVKAQTSNYSTPVQTLDSAGGEASGEAGSVSFSIGQLSYVTISDKKLEVFQGVQLPVYIETDISTPIAKTFNMDIQAYPNPTTDYFVINLKNYENEKLSYNFYNLQGKLIDSQPINSAKTRVDCTNLQAAVYLLSINYNNIPIKTLKIIKH